ncbi:2-keto-3-deoxygluconate permease [Clostridium sp. SHJSY1]|uniref:2-keto-3-deoxygluconate permease n=1 Tax=Clostridium sp. SHJSY1 TaxID=2942483 RepID=UPI0028741832|nr:2-keto-3-deoxygluconate permease [Clostridium sp. SHJSY1]MDS0526315.1 2-keto-3-deoxygluconate permease [Clostridium sp. SHJSY1]
MNILERVQKIPGGTMVIPMAIAAIINTFIPNVLQIGNPLTATFTSKGTMCVVGMMLVFTGIQIKPKQILLCLKRGGILSGLKAFIGIISGILIMKIFGMDGVAGISTLAWVACLTSCNPGLYIALMNDYGDEIDRVNYVLLNVIGLPFLPVCILGFANGNGIDYKSIAATLLPLLLGMILGCLDPKIREFSKDGIKVLIPFMGFCLGVNINLQLAIQSIGKGILLFLVYMIINFIPLYLVDTKLLKQRGHSATAISCVAGLAMTVPSLMVESDSRYLQYVNDAIAQLAFVVVISAIVTPWLIKKVVMGRRANKTAIEINS